MKKLVDRLLRREDIGDDGEGPYLRRWTLLSAFGWKLYLHRFMRSDTGRDLHDHPCDVICFVFRGRYVETTIADPPLAAACEPGPPITMKPSLKVCAAPCLRRFRAEHIHRIDLFSENEGRTWSLCLFFPKRKPWGFILDNGTWIRWDAYPRKPPPIRGTP